MKKAFKFAIVLALFATAAGNAVEEKERKGKTLSAAKANCQIRFTKQASGGSLMLSYDAKSQEDCLKLSDPETETLYRPAVSQRKRGAGPNE